MLCYILHGPVAWKQIKFDSLFICFDQLLDIHWERQTFSMMTDTRQSTGSVVPYIWLK